MGGSGGLVVFVATTSIEESGVMSCVFILFVYRVVIPQKRVELKSFSRSVQKVVQGLRATVTMTGDTARIHDDNSRVHIQSETT